MLIWNCTQEWSQQFSPLLKKWTTQVSMNSQWAPWHIHRWASTRNEKEGTSDTTWRDSKRMCQMKNTRFQKQIQMAIYLHNSLEIAKIIGKQISYCQSCVLIKKGPKLSRGWWYYVYYHVYDGGYTTVHVVSTHETVHQQWRTLTFYFNL